jgi:DNA polymerase III subunit gamma/tau
MVGQQHVLRALMNALDSDRVHHAFLFAGTRGVGKTTIARILAKSLNCEQGVSSTPCGTCSACAEIDEGRFVDLIEVDAASRTKVDDTRELLDNVQYAPTRGRFKVYLIDEVHMLSGHSFNALLKTLEEPPPHVKFLLATTDPQKLPVTILSRCLQFRLKRLLPDQITGHLAHVLDEEGIEYEATALKLLAHGADGSMRDALSLLDQAIAYCGGSVTESGTREMLGTLDSDGLLRLLTAVADGDGVAAVDAASELLDQSGDPEQLLVELGSALQRIALLQLVPGATDEDEDAWLVPLLARFSPEYVQLCYQFALHGLRDLPLAPEPRGGLEMVLLRMLAFRIDDDVEAPTGPVKQKTAPAVPKEKPAKKPAKAPGEAPGAAASAAGGDWHAIVESLPVKGVAMELARNCVPVGWDGDTYTLELDAAYERLRNEKAEARLRDALARHFGRDEMRLSIKAGKPTAETPGKARERKASERQEEAQASLAADPDLKRLTDTFDTGFDPDAVRPID